MPARKDIGATREPPSPGDRVPQDLGDFVIRQFLVQRLEQHNCRLERLEQDKNTTASHEIV